MLAPDEWQLPRPSLDYSWDRIESDFRTAADLLPLRSEYPSEDMGRATKGAAMAMLAKTHLYQEEWQEAYAAAIGVISSGEYFLVGDNEHPGPFIVTRLTKDGEIQVHMQAFKRLFQPEADNCPEAIFEVQHYAQHSGNFPQNQGGNLVPRYYGPRAVWAFNTEAGSFTNVECFWGFILPTDYFIETAYEAIGSEDAGGHILDPRYRYTVVEPTDSFPYYYSDPLIRAQYSDSVAFSAWYN